MAFSDQDSDTSTQGGSLTALFFSEVDFLRQWLFIAWFSSLKKKLEAENSA